MFARQAIIQGEWLLQHIPGEVMIADLTTKPLAGTRLDFLKKLMGMSPIPAPEEDEVEEKEKKGEVEGKKEIGILEAARIVKLITLAAQIQAARAQGEDEDEDESYPIEALFFYTMLVVMITLFAARLWKVAVQLWSALMHWLNALRAGSRPEVEAGGEGQKEEEGEEEKDERSEAPLPPEEETEAVPTQEAQDEQTPESQNSYHFDHELAARIEEEWREIEREERQIWRDLNSAPEGSHILGGPELASQPALRPLPFQVLTTRFGSVYHTDPECRYLTAPRTGLFRASEWCHLSQTRGVPPPGVSLFLSGWGQRVHTDERCPRIGNAVQYGPCVACNPSV